MASRRPRWKLFLAVGLLFLLLSCTTVTGVGTWLFFQLRPWFAAVLSAAEVRPTLRITARYDGAGPHEVEDAIALPMETQLTGMEGVESVESVCGDDGTFRMTLYLRPGTDLGTAKVLAQNRVALAEPMLPHEVLLRGISLTSGGPLPALWLFITSPGGQWDQTALRHVAQAELVPQLTALPGVEAAEAGGDDGPDLRWASWRGQVAVAVAVEGPNPGALFASVRDHLPALQQRLKEGMGLSLVPGPLVPGDGLLIEGQLPAGASTQRLLNHVERIAREIDHLPDARAESVAPAALTLPCERPAAFRLYLALCPAGERSSTSADIRAQARRLLAEVPDMAGRVVRPQSLTRPPRLRAPVVLSVTGPAFEETTQLADAVHERLAASGAVSDVWADHPRQVTFAFLVVDSEKANHLGVRLQDVMDTLRTFGVEANWQDGFRARREQILPLGQADAKTISNLKVHNDKGEMVPLRALANVREVTGPEFIHRIEGERRFLLTARPVPGVPADEARRRCREIAEQVLRERNALAGYQIDCAGSDTGEQD